MKFVYQTKVAGMLEPPARDTYRSAAMKLAAMCPDRTFFKGSFIKDPFRETLGLLSRAGASAIERSSGSAIAPAKNPEAAYAALFAKEIERFPLIVSEKNFTKEAEDRQGGFDEDPFSVRKLIREATEEEEISLKQADSGENEESDDAEAAEMPENAEISENKALFDRNPSDYICSRDVLYLGSETCEDDVLAVIALDILKKHSQKIYLELPPERTETLIDYIEAANSLGGEVSVDDSFMIKVNGEKSLTGGSNILPGVDWNVAVPGLCCSAIGFDVVVKNTFAESPFARKNEFIDMLTAMKLIYIEDEDGNAFFKNAANKVPTRFDARACGASLPYILFVATQTDGVTEFYNIDEEVIEGFNRSFYYSVVELKKLGVEFTSRCKGSMFVIGRNTFEGGIRIDCHNNYDVTAVAVLSTLCSKKANVLENCDVADWVCPDFWRLYKTIGGFAE